MKTNLPLRNLSILSMIFFLIACATGKKQFEQGDYDKATYQAINRLRNNPDSKKAQKYLPLAYQYAVDFHLKKIGQYKQSVDEFKYDDITFHYSQLNNLYNEIIQCPACINIVKAPKIFQNEFNESSLLASKAHFNAGVRELDKTTSASGRAAYRHFLDAKTYTPQYDKIESYLAKALDQGTIRVLVDDIPIHSRSLALTNEFFQNQILQYVRGLNYTFVRFYRTTELDALQIQPDEIIVMQFDDFVVGQAFLKETIENVSKDSVIISTQTAEDGTKVPIYGTAKAKVTTFEKTLTSSGLLDFQIVNAETGNTLQHQKFPGTFIWTTNWATFNGMEEALSKAQINMSKRREAYPPAPQDLFVEFTKPIYNQIISKIRNHYSVLAN